MTVERADVSLPSDPSQIAMARRFVRRTLTDRVDADVVADLQLVVSELVSNTIEHGGTDDVTVDLEWGAAAVSVAVTTDATVNDLGPVESWTIGKADQVSGRGLGIVREIADSVEIVDAGARRRLVVTIDLTRRS